MGPQLIDLLRQAEENLDMALAGVEDVDRAMRSNFATPARSELISRLFELRGVLGQASEGIEGVILLAESQAAR